MGGGGTSEDGLLPLGAGGGGVDCVLLGVGVVSLPELVEEEGPTSARCESCVKRSRSSVTLSAAM